MEPSHHYGNAVIIAPSCEDGFLSAYALEHPEEHFAHFTIEEVRELFAFDVIKPLDPVAPALRPIVTAMTASSYVSPRLQALIPLVKNWKETVICGEKPIHPRFFAGKRSSFAAITWGA